MKPNANIPVFVVRSPDGRERTLHRNHLLPVGTDFRSRQELVQTGLELEEKKEEVVVKPIPRPRRARVETVNTVKQQLQEPTVLEDQSDEEEYVTITYEQTVEDHSSEQNEEQGVDDDRNEEESNVEDNVEERNCEYELTHQPASPPILPRRSQRERRPPRWHDAYQLAKL